MRNRMRILEAALEDPDLILKSPWVCLPVVNKTLEYNISNHYREKVEKIMRKQASLIDKKPTLKALRHTGS